MLLVFNKSLNTFPLFVDLDSPDPNLPSQSLKPFIKFSDCTFVLMYKTCNNKSLSSIASIYYLRSSLRTSLRVKQSPAMLLDCCALIGTRNDIKKVSTKLKQLGRILI